MWDEVLKRTGFEGVETEVHDCESEEFYSISVMMSTASSSKPQSYDSDIVLVTSESAPPAPWLEDLKSSISTATGIVPTVESLETIVSDGKVCILLADLQQSILREPSPAQFETIKALCTRSKGLLWATYGGAVDCENPDASLSQGFLRTLRAEYAGKRTIALDLDPKNELWSSRSVSAISEVFAKEFDNSKSLMDFELADRGGVIHVPRYYRDAERNATVFPDPSSQVTAQLQAFSQAGRPLRLTVGTPGLLDTLAFDDDPDASKELRHDAIEVEPKAFGVNFRDVMVAMGQLEADYMGFECSGIVTGVGSTAAAQRFKVGDRIATLMRGHIGNLVRVDWTSAVHIPDDMTFETAATLPMSYSTAYFCLHDLGRVREGDKVLIHAATGGLGQAAIALAKHAGAEIFATAGTEKKREFLTSQYGIQPDHIFSSRDASFAPGVLAMTQGKGVDVVLNTLAGTLLQESFNCVARFGRFVEIGKRDLELNSFLEMGAFTRSVSFSSFDLLQFGEHKGLEVRRVMKEIIRLFELGVIAPVQPVTVYPLSEIEKSFRLMQAGKHMGKIVVSVRPDDLVPVSEITYFV
jgi:NADPH:quinone reductase-like Zn-dependent oxidoreductase